MSQIVKLIELIVKEELVNFLEENRLRDIQHGFRVRKSCLINLLEFLSKYK